MVKDYQCIKIKITTLAIGLEIRLKAEDLSTIIKEWYTLANGKMIKCMEEDKKNGLMELFLREYSKMESKSKENLVGQMGIYTRGSLKTINQKDLENSPGQMEDFIKASGKIMLCMAKANFNGRMDRNSWDIMKTTKNKAKENCNLVMELLQKGHGLMENLMEKVLFQTNKGKIGWQSGVWELK